MKSTLKELPLPSFYKPAHAASFGYGPDASKLMAEAHSWSKAHGVTPAATDKFNLHLLLIDVQ